MGLQHTETKASIPTVIFTIKFTGISLLPVGKSMTSQDMKVGSSTWQLEVSFRANHLSVALRRVAGARPAIATIELEMPAHTVVSDGPVTVLEEKAFMHRNFLGKSFQMATQDTVTFLVQLTPSGDEPVNWRPQSTNTILESMLFDPTHADLMLIVQGERLPAHRCLLSSRSSVFQSMFHPSPSPSTPAAEGITLSGTAAAAREAIRFLYTGALHEDQLHVLAPDLLGFACTYQIEDLRGYIEDYCLATLSLTSVKEIMRTAEKHDRSELRTSAMKFIAAHLKTLAGEPGFLEGLSGEECRELLLLQQQTQTLSQ